MDLSAKLASNLDDLQKMFESRMGDYEAKLQASDTSPAHRNIASLSQDFSEFKCFVLQTMSKLKAQIELISLGLDRHETFLRKKVLLFHGVAENKEEQLNSVIVKLLHNQLHLAEIHEKHLLACHRLGPWRSSQSKPRAVLVRFGDFELRRSVWDSKTALKGSGITISEFLTKARHSTFIAARKHFGVNRCWSTEGKIMIVLPDKTRTKVEAMAELRPLIARFPAAAAGKTDVAQAAVNPLETASKSTKGSAAAKSRRRLH
ncbi:uncharacterized protein LOC113232862 [Hyposmocoma kahamanoa]|uniref:uncharacterized protein LOC113232862 n=1 Tax=Hyposmocoma kahamanoa TaxID=1477025 RepID=UPI000E6D79CE|nr:uncharacterized protein LOC113232862 [Hyposmocoma kahamanoa]